MVDGDQLAALCVESREAAIAADAAHGRLDHITHEGRGHEGIEGIAAGGQYGQPRLHLHGMAGRNNPAVGFGLGADMCLAHASGGAIATERVTLAVAPSTLQIGQCRRASSARSRRVCSGAAARMVTLSAPSAM